MSERREIPSVDRAVKGIADVGLPRQVAAMLARKVFEGIRAEGGADEATAMGKLRAEAERLAAGRIVPVINGTGVIVHTNLGRSPLGEAAVEAVRRAAGEYNTLEFDVGTGERGTRGAYVEALLAAVCNAGGATVVNNCAAALVLVVQHLTRGAKKEVVISRGELVQIGGGFRVHEILQASGAVLREVGATNKTTLADYAGAIGENTAMILKVHRSNFWMEGFVESVGTGAVAGLAKERGVVLVEDLGSGAVHEGMGEVTAGEVLRAGADLVCFSGDKLFGGPQAGIVAGEAGMVAGLKREPLFRALRCDKMVLAGLEATVAAHLAGRVEGVPTVAMMGISVEVLRARAGTVVAVLKGMGVEAAVVESVARVGGGSLPREEIASVAVEVRARDGRVEALARRLRCGRPAVIGYIEAGAVRLDMRTVFARQDGELAAAVAAAVKG